MNKTWIVFLLCLFVSGAFAQDLFKERIRKIDGKKRGIYLDQGVFSFGNASAEATALTKIRHSYRKSEGFERIVFDFTSSQPAKLYSYMGKTAKKLYLDFFQTQISGDVGSFGTSPFVQAIDIFPVDENQVSLELNFKTDVNVEVFYLTDPGRLVIDVKK